MADNGTSIENREELETWLEGKNPSWGRAISARAALRVLPLISSVSSEHSRDLDSLCLAVFHATHIAWASHKYSGGDILASANYADTEATTLADKLDRNGDKSAAYAAYSAADAAYAVLDGDFSSGAPAAAAEAAAEAIRLSGHAEVEFWKSVQADARFMKAELDELELQNNPRNLSHIYASQRLMDEPLWYPSAHSGYPDWVIRSFDQLVRNFQLKSSGFDLWFRWYSALLPSDARNKPRNFFHKEIDLAIAIQPEQWWKRSAVDVNNEIGALIEENSRKNNPTIRKFILEYLIERSTPVTLTEIRAAFVDAGYTAIAKNVPRQLSYLASEGRITRVSKGVYAVIQRSEADPEWAKALAITVEQPNGFTFAEEDGQLAIAASGSETDQEAAADPLTNQLHAEVQRRANAFQETAARLDNQIGWRGVASASSRLASNLNEGPSHVAERIGEVWSDIVELGSFLDQDRTLRSSASASTDPLEPEARRQLESLISIASPWVRRFPTAVLLDTESAVFASGRNLVPEARSIIENARSTGLLRHRDADVLDAILDTAERSEMQGAKARTFGTQSSRNIIVRSAKTITAFIFGLAAGVAAPNSMILKPAVDFYLSTEPAIIAIVKDMPNDIGFAYRFLIERLRTDPPTLPSAPDEKRDVPTDQRRRRSKK